MKEYMPKDTPKKKREFGVILESIDSNVKQTLELVHTHTKQITELQKDVGSLQKDLTEVKDDVAVIKVAVGVVEGEKPLKQRVEELEAKAS